MDGANLREEIMEVAFEQWTERADASVDFNVIPTLQGINIGKSCIGRVQRKVSEFRW